ncbi:MAG: leucyl aminopeptidase, partial [Desulfobacterales bacterium]|nr:leucyl aminopeptidase [Desulfobacterales bacterium]
GAYLARNWVNLPSNDKRPEVFAESIAALARREGLAVKILNEKDLQRQKFGALLAVAAGSRSKPRLLSLAYTPENARETVVLAGKGVTFDTGGINLKGTASLAGMKADMSGAAAVAATLVTVARHLKPLSRIIGIIPVVENMPSGSAMRPGDIVRSYDGKTIEIGNTDAEGRLILADAIAYAVRRFKPDILIDLATLTGACVVALGEKIAGVFSPDDQLADRIVHAGVRTNERCWRLPLPEDYRPMLKSDIADTKNISGSRYGGAITAALFLSGFVRQGRWAHIDIAGPAYSDKDTAYCPAGGTGFGVRLLCEFLTNL